MRVIRLWRTNDPMNLQPDSALIADRLRNCRVQRPLIASQNSKINSSDLSDHSVMQPYEFDAELKRTTGPIDFTTTVLFHAVVIDRAIIWQRRIVLSAFCGRQPGLYVKQ